ncbi:MAG: Fic family protein [Eggerthellaceae bacterium]|nr:Fic family protein [Eggerthellaceae bacterium]
MRKFDYQHLPASLFDGKVGDAHVRLFEDKGKLDALEQLHPDVFTSLQTRALFDSTESSAHIEGLYADSARVREIVAEVVATPVDAARMSGQGNVHPFDDELENQLAGNAHALQRIYTDCDQMELSTSTIVALYEMLFGHRDLGRKSRYRKKDYMYVQVDGRPQAMPVSPITAFETPLVLGGACDSLAESFDAHACSPLVLAAVFTVDFLCIRPFDEGNGRIARLFATLLLEKAGFRMTRYLGVERLIERNAMAYYDALNACVDGWDVGKNDYAPYALYWFQLLHDAHRELFRTVELELRAGNSKTERVRLIVGQATQPMGKREILDAAGNVSEATVELVLGQMVKDGEVEKVGSGRATKYLPR